MKTLCLIRHAKSSWAHPLMDDHERPLDHRGEVDATDTGKFLLTQKIKPNLILTSPAKRALETAQFIATAMDYDQDKILTDEAIYEAGVEDLLHIIQQTKSNVDTLVVIGHNPGLTWLANYLADSHVVPLPTCGAFCVTFNTNDWNEITMVEGKTLFVHIPEHTD